jgi:electron transport complex protein RnfG
MSKKIGEVMVLFLVGIISAFLLSFVYKQTLPVISKHREETINSSLREVYSDKAVSFKEIKPDTLWKVFKDDKLVGLIFRFEKKGYSGKIRPIVAVDSMGKIIGVKIPKEELTETPGLGMKIAEESFINQFKGLSQDEIWLKKDKKRGKIDAVTSATISSRAATAAVREGLVQYEELLPGYQVRTFIRTSLDSLEQEAEEILPDKLWEISGGFIFHSQVKDSSFVCHILVDIEDETIQKTLIFMESPEAEDVKVSEKREAIKELEKIFRMVSIKNIDKLEFTPEVAEIGEKIKKEIKTEYEKINEGK